MEGRKCSVCLQEVMRGENEKQKKYIYSSQHSAVTLDLKNYVRLIRTGSKKETSEEDVKLWRRTVAPPLHWKDRRVSLSKLSKTPKLLQKNPHINPPLDQRNEHGHVSHSSSPVSTKLA